MVPPTRPRRYSVLTALRSEKPSDTSLCDTWSVPPFVALRPASLRKTRTNAVSKSGTMRINTTITAGLMNASGALYTGTSEAAPSIAPMKRLPQSPMNRRARLRFQYRNPSNEPASAVRRTTSVGPRYPGSNAARKAAAMSPTPAARPSMLSSRFMAWQMPANQTVATSV